MAELFALDSMAILYRNFFAMIRSPMINSKGLNTSGIYGFFSNEYLKPIIPPKYDIGLVVENCNNSDMLGTLEPYCNQIYLKEDKLFQDYIDSEQPNCRYDLGAKLVTLEINPFNDVLIYFDASKLNNENFQRIFLNFPRILEESGEPDSDFELDIFGVKIKTLDNQVDTLVNSVCK